MKDHEIRIEPANGGFYIILDRFATDQVRWVAFDAYQLRAALAAAADIVCPLPKPSSQPEENPLATP